MKSISVSKLFPERLSDSPKIKSSISGKVSSGLLASCFPTPQASCDSISFHQAAPEILICHFLSSRQLRSEIPFQYKRMIIECQFHVFSVNAKDKDSHIKILNRLFSCDYIPIPGDDEYKYYY